MRKTRLMLAALVVVVMAALTAGCGKSNTPTAVQTENQTVNLDTAVNAPTPNFNNTSSTTVPIYDNASSVTSGGGCGGGGSVFDNTSTAVDSPKAMSVEANPLYGDQNVEAGRNGSMIANFVHRAGDKSDWVNRKYVVDFYSLTEYRYISLKNVYVKAGGNVLSSVDSVGFDSQHHMPTEFYDGTQIPKGTAILVEVIANLPPDVAVDTQFLVTIRAVGETDDGNVGSTDEIYGQVMTFAKSEVGLVETENLANKGAVVNSEMIAGIHSIISGPFLAMASMEFSVAGMEAVNQVNIYEPPQPGLSPKLIGSAVPFKEDYNGKAIINFDTPVALGGVKKFVSGVKLNDKTGVMVDLRLTSFTTVNAAGERATYSVDSQGSWVRTVKALPVIHSNSIPTKHLVTGRNVAYSFTMYSNGGKMGWKQSPAFTLKHQKDLVMDFYLVDKNTGMIIPAPSRAMEDGDYGNGVITIVNLEAVAEQMLYWASYDFIVEVKSELNPFSYLIISMEPQSNSYGWVSSGRYQDYNQGYKKSRSFLWSDHSASNHTLDSYDWYDDTMIKLPTEVQTLTVQTTTL